MFNLSRNHDLNVGDTVRLKCGGFPIVVHKIRGNKITCVWQHIEGMPFEKTYDSKVLCRVSGTQQ